MIRITTIFLIMLCFPVVASSWQRNDSPKQPTVITHPTAQSFYDRRYVYALKLLRLILDRTVDTYGIYELKPSASMTQDRIIVQIEQGLLDVAHLPISEKAGQRLLPVRIPIRKGMLGWRLLLIRREDQHKFANVRTIEDLRKFKAGFGSQWGDLNILKTNVGEVTTNLDYELLFSMLIAKRFDYLHRGLHEPWDEVALRKETYPTLHIEKTLVLHYPIGDYFYVGKQNPSLAERIESGFRALIEDGSFDRFFNKEYGKIIEQAKIPLRRRIDFQNPFLPFDTPLDIKEYWISFE